MKFLYLLVLFFLAGFFFVIYGVSPVEATTYSREGVLVNPSASYATCGDSSVCGNLTECWNSQSPGVTDCGSACRIDGVPFGSAWTKYRYSYCAETQYDPITDEAICAPVYNSVSAVYSTADKCSDGSANPPAEPYLRGGNCSGGIGGWYKTCCSNTSPYSYIISDPRSGSWTNSCIPVQPFSGAPYPPYDGVCPGGSHWVACGFGSNPACGQEACGPLPPTCTTGTTYTQCGGTGGCTNNYPANHTVNITPSSCSDGSTTYSCTDTGVFPGQCGNPLTCSVSFSLSNSNPPTNSTVNVSVTGLSSNAGWSNVAYSLDGGYWNTNVSVPNPGTTYYTFNVNSDSAGPHSLRFAVNSGSVICSSSGLNSFSTQAPPQNNNASCGPYTVNGGNTVYVGGTVPVAISMTNSGDTTWTSSSLYRLGAEQPQDDPNWGTSTGADSGLGTRPTRQDLSSNVGPGGSAPFNFNVTAPTVAGTYRLSFKMVKEGIEWFGQMCQRDVVAAVPVSGFVPSCTGTVTSAATRTIRWDATVSPSGTYTYSWSGDASGTGASVTQTYATSGTKNATVSVRNSSGTLRTASCTATITPFSYSLTNTGNRSMTRGSSVSNTINANLISGATQVVSLSASGFPSGVTGSFGPTSCNPTCSSILTMSASSAASTGTFPITVTATSSGASNQTTSFNLTVTAPATNTPAAFTQNAPTPACSGTSPYVDLSWTSSTNATSYEVYRNGSFTTGGLAQLNYRDSTVSPSTSYTYVIRARNSIGSIDSSSRSVTALSCTSGSTPPPTSAPSSGCAWIQTTGGDVHSNTGINTPCGP